MVRGVTAGEVEIKTVYTSAKAGLATATTKITVVSAELSLIDPPGPLVLPPRANELLRPLRSGPAHRTPQAHFVARDRLDSLL